MIWNWGKNGTTRLGINYDFCESGHEFVLKIPILPFYVKRYCNFDTLSIDSGLLVICLSFYLRKRRKSYFSEGTKLWIFDYCLFPSRFGKQKCVERGDQEFRTKIHNEIDKRIEITGTCRTV